MKQYLILNPAQREKSKTYLVNKIRNAVFAWRSDNYPGISETTKRLLNFWFKEDHIVENDLFSFWFCQREAIETLIYVYEVMKLRKFIDLAREFGQGPISAYDPSYDQYPLYAFKMATGSGKTFVMALAIVWSYFNWKFENKDDFTSKFLIISPNVIVYDRLKRDFQDLKIFKSYPFIPPEWQDNFNLKIILREDPIYTIPEEVLFLTNIQQLEERKSKEKETEEFVDEKLGLPTVSNISDIAQSNRIREVLTTCPNIMILKDEAHHIYNFEKAWKKILLELHKNLISQYGKGINVELDFSATPKTETGAYFPWIISDFTLKEAIQMNIVKLPLKGIVKKASEVSSSRASERYKAWIDAGIRRFREYRDKLKKLGKKPVLFIMCEDTKQADDVFKYVNSISDLKGKVLLIHTNLRGEIIQKDLNEARKVARLIDEPDNPYDVIVSVMMLNEGWDVKSVVAIVGLRSYTSKRKVLPEQVIGRGLRKLFPEESANPKNNINVLEVIGPPGLLQVLEELEKQEGIKFAEFDTGTKVELTTIFVDENKLEKNIRIPIISPRIVLREPNLEELDLEKIPEGGIKLENKVLETEYIAKRMDTDAEVIRRKWTLPVPQDTRSVIAYYTQKILKELKIPTTTNFEKFYPLVKEYVCKKLFKEKVNLDDPRVLFNLSQSSIEEFLVGIFVDGFKDLTFKEVTPEKQEFIDLGQIKPFVWSKQVYPANKCIFNYVPCENAFEINFAKFLDTSDDILAFTKIVSKIGFFIEYLDQERNIRFYYPDFVVKTIDDKFLLIETKGRIDIEVPIKDQRARVWCEDATRLTGKEWRFVRIDQKEFEKHYWEGLKKLLEHLRI
ncbi:MAG: hypothetical protein B6D56_07990 [Candidatus Omnitrophica bacterium 4484_70.1]|nr:MAG: hypothetical protein B6D56_07990 [Candidatus Omnitrophica bacterium 4484_70.1]